MRIFTGILAAAAAFTVATTSVAFADGFPTDSFPAVAADPTVVALVPKEIKDRGTLRIATVTKYPPYAYAMNGKLVGMIPEVVTAVAQTMGLKPEIATMDFPSILIGLQAQKYDIGMGEYFVRKDRLEVADFVTEWSNFDTFLVPKDSTYLPKTLDDTCGHKIAILAGSSGPPAMEVATRRCKELGKPAPEVSNFPEMSNAVLALTSNHAEAVLTGTEVGVAMIKSGQPFITSGRASGGPTATAVARNDNSDGLLQALQAAYTHVIADGTYAKIHKRWGTDYGMIDKPTIYRKGDQPPSYSE